MIIRKILRSDFSTGARKNMLKHGDIIGKLNIKQKLALAASVNALNEPWAAQAGIPHVEMTDLYAENAGNFPSLFSLANSWNLELIRECIRNIGGFARENGAKMIIIENSGVKGDPLDNGISEDPYLCGEILRATAEGVQKSGVYPCFVDFIGEQMQKSYAENNFSLRKLQEISLAPLRKLPNGISYFQETGMLAQGAVECVLSTLRDKTRNGGYVFGGRGVSLNSGAILTQADAASLANAYEKGLSIKQGEIKSAAEIVTEKELDEALDKVIDFAMTCSSVCQGETAASDGILLRAAEESIVLLKNENILPFKKKSKLAVVGLNKSQRETFFNAAQEDERLDIEFVDEVFARLEGKSSFVFTYNLRRVLHSAEAVVLFFNVRGTEISEEKARRFTNFLAWIEKARKINPNVIAVIPADSSLDVSFAVNVAGLLVADINCSCGVQAVVNILSGKTCPSGKLALSFYRDINELAAQAEKHKNAGLVKDGPFVGYLGYDTAKTYPPFPFGFGLSYTSFSCSNMSLKNGIVEFTACNNGKFDGAEVFQLYVEKVGSAVVRPRKKLAGFCKVFLCAGEKKCVKITVDYNDLAVFNGADFAVESGVYEFILATSLREVKLCTYVNVGGTELISDNENIAEYIEQVPNIVSENFAFREVKKKKANMPRGTTMLKTGVWLISIALFFGLISLIAHETGYINLFYMESVVESILSLLCVCVLPQMLVVGIGLIIGGILDKSRYLTDFAERELSAPVYVPAEIQSEQSYEQLFASVFSENKEDENFTKTEESETIEEEYTEFDATLTFSSVCENLYKFVVERGIELQGQSARNLFAAMSASRAVLLKSVQQPLMPRFFGCFSEYFGGEVVLRDAAEVDNAAIFIEQTMKYASENREKIILSVWNNADVSSAEKVLEKFAEYVRSPLTATDDSGAVYPPNVWFFFTAEHEFYTKNLPFVTAEISLCQCEEKDEKTDVTALKYVQFIKMISLARKRFCLDEEKCWKKADKIEEYLRSSVGKTFSNRRWEMLEKYSSVFCACGGEQAASLDSALACVCVVQMYDLMKQKVTPKEFSRKISDILGAQESVACKKSLADFISNSGAKQS